MSLVRRVPSTPVPEHVIEARTLEVDEVRQADAAASQLEAARRRLDRAIADASESKD